MSEKIPYNQKKRLNILPENPDKEKRGRFPTWLHRKLPHGGNLFKTTSILEKYKLNTVCEEAKCPNRFECYTKKTATFLALGKACTRNCGFCDIDFTKTPKAPDENEPMNIAASVAELGLLHAVITMVARDDLPCGGASHMAQIVQAIRALNPNTTIETLTSDFSGNLESLHILLDSKPEIFNHNIETVRSLTPRVRHKATYDRTLQILKEAKQSKKSILVKSGIMVGLGEKQEEVLETIADLHEAGCDVVTVGHYLQASLYKLTVKEFIPVEQFQLYTDFGLKLGIPHMYCGPFVRSSYNAKELLDAHRTAQK